MLPKKKERNILCSLKKKEKIYRTEKYGGKIICSFKRRKKYMPLKIKKKKIMQQKKNSKKNYVQL